MFCRNWLYYIATCHNFENHDCKYWWQKRYVLLRMWQRGLGKIGDKTRFLSAMQTRYRPTWRSKGTPGRRASKGCRLIRPSSLGGRHRGRAPLSSTLGSHMPMKPVLAILALLSSQCLAADESVTANGTSRLIGRWDPLSRAYQGSPGSFSISKNEIRFSDKKCPHAAIEILGSENREDSEMDSYMSHRESAAKVYRYRDTRILVKRPKSCEHSGYSVMRFLFRDGTGCSAHLLLYQNKERLKQNLWDAWGLYSGGTC